MPTAPTTAPPTTTWPTIDRRTSAALALGICLMAMPACTKNAATGRSHFNYYSRDQEIAIGLESRGEIVRAYGGEIGDAGIRAYMAELGNDLAQHTEADYPSLPWKFTLLDSDVINAFALPGGQVFVSRALAEQLDDEAALAGELGHEIGHVTAEHVDEAMGRKMVLAGIALGANVASSNSDSKWAKQAAGVAVTGAGVFSLKFDRKQELEADRLGMRYMYRAGYDPSALADVMIVLRESAADGSPPELFSTHPHAETRIRKIEKRMESERYAATRNNPAFVRNKRTYEQRMLRRIAMMPAGDGARTGLAMHDASTFCAICASRRSSE